jgi:hypothetical protein
MRAIVSIVVAGIALGLSACSPAKPPVGRWEGSFQSPDTMIVARLKIEKNGAIFLSAPDALNVSTDPDQRAIIRARLAQDLVSSWPLVQPRQMHFNGHIFRYPGRVAPQMKWDASTKTMTVIVYPGTLPEVDIPMHPVTSFSSDPWQN